MKDEATTIVPDIYEVDGVSIFCIENGLIKKHRGYYDHLSALEQILPPVKWLLLPRL